MSVLTGFLIIVALFAVVPFILVLAFFTWLDWAKRKRYPDPLTVPLDDAPCYDPGLDPHDPHYHIAAPLPLPVPTDEDGMEIVTPERIAAARARIEAKAARPLKLEVQ